MIAIVCFLAILILITYIFYPATIILLSKNKKTNTLSDVEYNNINIIIPIHNEEKIIGQKLASIVASDYPTGKIKIHIGLDNCTDNSLNIINQYDDKLDIQKYIYNERIGKPNIINEITKTLTVQNDIILFTDADIILEHDTIKKINAAFNDTTVGIVDVHLENIASKNIEENTYNTLENKTKKAEALLFNLFQGASGACYAIRRKYFKPIPQNFLVDDYYISINVFLQNGKGIFLDDCVVYEHKTTTIEQEFKRKKRIAAGNFQNAWHFKSLFLIPHKAIAYTFVFHKLLRWLTPFFLIFIAAYLLINYTLIIFVLTLILSMLAFLLSIFGVKYNLIKIVSYFLIMQLAILLGFIQFLIGIKSNIWQPTPK